MNVDRRRIKAVIFDLDDTLIDWANLSTTFEEFYRPRAKKLYNFLVEAGHGLPTLEEFVLALNQAIIDTWDEAKRTWSIKSYGEILCNLLAGMDLDTSNLDRDSLLNVIGWDPWPGVVVFPDTISVLSELRERKYKIGLLTNSFLPMWMRDRELEAYKLLDYFDARLTAAEVGYVKPHPNIYHALLDMLGITAGQAVFVGDRPKNDIAGANAVGLISVLMDPPHVERDLEGHIPDYTISRLSELLPILDELEQMSLPATG